MSNHRVTLAVSASVGVHLLAAVLVVGSSLWRGWPAAPVDVEITGMRLEDLQDLPLGAPAAGEQRSDAVIAPAPHAPRSLPTDSAEHDPTQPKPRAKLPRHPPGPPVVEADPRGGAAPPRPTSVRSYGPQGSRVTALVRLDRLRGTAYASALDALLMNLPDRQDLLEGTGVDLYGDIDAILIATPNPLDPRVTFLAARHRLTDGALRAALERGARATNRQLTWRTERGRPFAERRPAGPTATDLPGKRDPKRDNRLILLPAPHLVVVTPPAYRSLILRGDVSGGKAHADAADADVQAHAHTDADAGASAAGGAGGSAGHPPAAESNGWAALLRRIDAEDSIMPADAVAMVSASDLFSVRTPTLRGTLDVVPGTRGSVDDSSPTASPAGATGSIMGLPVPRMVTATVGITPHPFADVDGEFGAERDAHRWQDEWPALKHKLLSNPLVVLSGFSALIGRITLDRAGATIHVHLDATELETTRILQLLAMQLGALRH
ncbi:MAG: hypothetical protein ABIS92_16305 [Polyangia bacterium]